MMDQAHPSLTGRTALDQAVLLARELGLDIDAGLSAAGHDAYWAGQAHIPLIHLARFLDWAAQQSGRADFSLMLGGRFHPADLGVFGYMLMNAATLGAALALGRRLGNFQQQGNALWGGLDDARHFELRYSPTSLPVPLQRQDSEYTLAIAHAVLCHLAGQKVTPLEIRVQYPARTGDPDLAKHFGCFVHYEAEDNAVRYDRALLDRPIAGADPRLLQILTHYVERDLLGMPAPGDLVTQIRSAIRHGLARGQESITFTAHQCAMSIRTLQRRLSDQGLTYSGLLDDVRREIVTGLDQAGSHRQYQIAQLAGFNDASALHKARRRWIAGQSD